MAVLIDENTKVICQRFTGSQIALVREDVGANCVVGDNETRFRIPSFCFLTKTIK